MLVVSLPRPVGALGLLEPATGADRGVEEPLRAERLVEVEPAEDNHACVERDRAPRRRPERALHHASVGILHVDLPVAHLARARDERRIPAPGGVVEQRADDVASGLRERRQPSADKVVAEGGAVPAGDVVREAEPVDRGLKSPVGYPRSPAGRGQGTPHGVAHGQRGQRDRASQEIRGHCRYPFRRLKSSRASKAAKRAFVRR